MQVLFETAWLAPGQIQSAADVTIDGEQVIDDADFFRAATRTFFPRGNEFLEFAFTTHWSFQTTTAAEVFVLTHIGQLPMTNADVGPLQCICGAESSSPQTVYAPAAVLRHAAVRYTGTSVDVRYTLLIPAFTTSVPPNIPAYPNPNELVQVFRRGKQLLTPGQTSVAVLFSSPLPGNPGADPECYVTASSGSPTMDAWCQTDTVTTLGFTAILGAAVPNTGTYYLNYTCFM